MTIAPRQSWVTVAGTRLETWRYGPAPGQGPTLVLLHEGLGCAALWRDFPARLVAETGWGVVAVSRAGYGQSDTIALPRPLDYMTREATEVLPELLNALGVTSVVLLGHSDGATIAAIHAGAVRDARIRGVVLMAPHFFTELIALDQIARARDAYVNGRLKERLAKYHADPDAAFWGWNRAWLDPGFRDWDVRALLSSIQCPVLAIQGRDDEYGTDAQIHVITDRCPTHVESAILDRCRHSPHLDQPDEVVSRVVRFCQRVGADVPFWPPHAYIPGQTPRHPDGLFDAIRDTAVPGSVLPLSTAYRVGIAYLDAGYFWEAHEVLEPVWMALPDPSADRAVIQALIQIANGHLKLRMGKPKAAARLHAIAHMHAQDAVSACDWVGADLSERLSLLKYRGNVHYRSSF